MNILLIPQNIFPAVASVAGIVGATFLAIDAMIALAGAETKCFISPTLPIVAIALNLRISVGTVATAAGIVVVVVAAVSTATAATPPVANFFVSLSY